MAPLSRMVPALLLLLANTSIIGVCNGLVETCQDMQDAFYLTKTQDVVVEIDPRADITCSNFTTMSMDSNTLTVIPTGEELCEYCWRGIDLTNIRFEVTNGAKLFWEPEVAFIGTGTQNVNGGAVYVGEGSSARFYDKFETEDVGVRSLTYGADYATYMLSGGCVYVDGYFRVDGDATFVRCEVGGGGESSPGPGGGMYVGETGSVLFAGEVSMSEFSIIDDDGDNGGGIYNKGKVNIKGNAEFLDLRAEAGGAIFNDEGAEFRFKSGATALFSGCYAHDGVGGAVYNKGYFKFSGPALFLNSDAPSVYVASTGYTRLSEDSVFWGALGEGIGEDIAAAVEVRAGGRLTGESTAQFVNGAETGCATVYYEDGDICL